MNNYLDVLLSMFNQFIFAEAKANIESVKYYYTVNPATSGNKLYEELISAIENYDLDSVGEPLFRAIFMKCGKNKTESDELLKEIIKWKSLSKEEILPFKKHIQNITASSILRKANKKFEDDPAEFIKYIKNVNFQTSELEIFSSRTVKDFDIKSILSDDSKGAIKTNYEWLNNAFAPYYGLERGQLGIISAPPGTGKSLICQNLAIWMAAQGEKVLYVTLGDMNYKDFLIRGASIAFGVPFSVSAANLGEAYKQLGELVKDNLEISINPAGVITANEIVDYVKSKDFSVVVIDYDGNIAGVNSSDSMYNTYGDIYNTFTKLTLDGKLVLVCSQCKINTWGAGNVIGLDGMADSSKKQHSADFIVTLSKTALDCPNHLYTMSLPKARRGEEGSMAYVIRLNSGRFIEIPRGIYEQLKSETEKVEYTENQINTMKVQFKIQEDKIKQSLNNISNNNNQ